MSDELAQGNTMHTRKFFASYISIAFGFSVQKVFSTFSSLAGSVFTIWNLFLKSYWRKNGNKTTTKKPTLKASAQAVQNMANYQKSTFAISNGSTMQKEIGKLSYTRLGPK